MICVSDGDGDDDDDDDDDEDDDEQLGLDATPRPVVLRSCFHDLRVARSGRMSDEVTGLTGGRGHGFGPRQGTPS